jgi:hypothetical protein
MQLAIMDNGGVRRQNRRFHRRTIAVREDSMQRNLDDVSEIQFDLVMSPRIEKPIERLPQLGFEVADDAYDLVDRLLIQHTARSVDEKTNVFVKFDVGRKFHHATLHELNEVVGLLPAGKRGAMDVIAPHTSEAGLRFGRWRSGGRQKFFTAHPGA